MIRVGIDARLNAYRDGGIAEYTRRLTQTLAALVMNNDPALGALEFQVIQHRRAKGTPAALDVLPLQITFAMTPPHHRLESVTFSAEVAAQHIDLLHSPDFIPPLFGARRYVITVMDLSFLILPETQTAAAQRYYRGQIRRAVKQAAHILCISQATRTDLINLLNVPSEKITVQILGYNSAFRPLSAPDIAPTLKRYNLTPGYILFVGTLEPRKNIPALIAAHAALQSQNSAIPPLVIVGRRGWNEGAIVDAIHTRQKSASYAVHWIEDAPFADMPALLNGAALHINPSLYEGFGFPTLEAMACGVPVAVADRGALPELAGPHGLCFNPDQPDAIMHALETGLHDSTWRVQATLNGLTRATRYTWEEGARQAVTVYQQIMV